MIKTEKDYLVELMNITQKELSNSMYGGRIDYLLNTNNDEYSWIYFVDDDKQVDMYDKGWNIYFVKNEGYAIQVVNNKYGTDYHILTTKEMTDCLTYVYTSAHRYQIKNNKND